MQGSAADLRIRSRATPSSSPLQENLAVVGERQIAGLRWALPPGESGVGVQPGGNLPPSRPRPTLVRRGVGVAAVLFLLGCAVVLYLATPGFPTSGSSPSTTANPSVSTAPTKVGTSSATAGGVSSSAGPSRASDPRPPTSTTTPGASDKTTGSVPAEEKTIRLEASAESAKPFQTIPISGTYRGGPETLLRVQRWEAGTWLAFPLPTKTDRSGRFTAHVELAQPGRHRLRVLDPGSGVTSKPFVLVIKG